MNLVSRVLGVSIAALVVACDAGTMPAPRGFANAAVTPACAPNDGAAIEIYLSPMPIGALAPPAPYIRVSVWAPMDSLVGTTRSVGSSSDKGAGWFYSTATNFEMADRGAVTVTSFSSDGRVDGMMDVSFPHAGRYIGGFTAKLRPLNALCG